MVLEKASFPTERQVSAGGVVYRGAECGVEIAIIAVPGKENRWQLPKGIVDEGEEPEETALREVREETGVESELIEPIDTIEYWYVGHSQGRKVRFHKWVHFYLMRYVSGDIGDYDRREVAEARWVSLDEALAMLTYENERQMVRKALAMLDVT